VSESILTSNIESQFFREETHDPLTGHVLRTYRHRSGFLVKILPRPRFSRRFAGVTVPFGSVHLQFRTPQGLTTVPAGSAHFLEHCIFSRDDDGGLLGSLSRIGASANAYTTHTHTLYYFSTTEPVNAALERYLGAILNPDISETRIEAERPVILSELDMYQDDPDSRIFSELLAQLYEKHPVRIDIGGAAESVKAITSADLKAIVDTYYHPSSLSLTLVGDIDENAVLTLLARMLPEKRQAVPETVRVPEPSRPAVLRAELRMDVATPSFMVGIKDPVPQSGQPLSGRELAARQRAGRLVFDTLLSEASAIHEELFDAGLIHDSFGVHYACEPDFAFAAAGGESDRPEEAAERLVTRLVETWNEGLDPRLFTVQKKAAAGDFLRSFDSIDHSGMVQARCNLYPVDLFDYPAIYDKIDLVTLHDSFAFIGDRKNYSVTILNPIGGTDSNVASL